MKPNEALCFRCRRLAPPNRQAPWSLSPPSRKAPAPRRGLSFAEGGRQFLTRIHVAAMQGPWPAPIFLLDGASGFPSPARAVLVRVAKHHGGRSPSRPTPWPTSPSSREAPAPPRRGLRFAQPYPKFMRRPCPLHHRCLLHTRRRPGHPSGRPPPGPPGAHHTATAKTRHSLSSLLEQALASPARVCVFRGWTQKGQDGFFAAARSRSQAMMASPGLLASS